MMTSIIFLLLIAAAITSMIVPVNAQVITLEPIETLAPNTLSLNISFANNTNATLDREPITEEQGNAIITAINTLLEAPMEELEPILEEQLEEQLEAIEEEEIEEEEEESGNDNGGNGNGDDNGNGSGNENGNGDEPEPIEPPIFEPGEDEEEELVLEQEIRTPVICIALAGVDCPGPIPDLSNSKD